jgi:outer membrane lipoprotein SlyB
VDGIKKLHPLVATASVAVIVLAGVGVAAFTGILPGSKGASEPSTAPAPATASAPEAKAPEAKAPVAKAPVAKPVHKAVRHAAAPKRAEPVRRTQVAEAKPACPDCGVVEGVREVEVKGKGTGLGVVAGGVAGALVGHELGGGNARTLMGVVGAVGGAVAGNEIEKRARATKQWVVTVRLEDGSTHEVTLAQQPPLHPGDHVRLAGNVIEPAPR